MIFFSYVLHLLTTMFQIFFLSKLFCSMQKELVNNSDTRLSYVIFQRDYKAP